MVQPDSMCELFGFSRSSCSPPCPCRWCGVHDEVCTCGQMRVTQASVALPRPYIGGVGGPCWISLDSVWTPPSGPCWSYKTSQWEPVVLLILWDFSVGANMLVYLHLWWYLRTIVSLHSCLPVVLTAVLHKCIWGVVVEAFRGNQTWIWGVWECLCVCL